MVTRFLKQGSEGLIQKCFRNNWVRPASCFRMSSLEMEKTPNSKRRRNGQKKKTRKSEKRIGDGFNSKGKKQLLYGAFHFRDRTGEGGGVGVCGRFCWGCGVVVVRPGGIVMKTSILLMIKP